MKKFTRATEVEGYENLTKIEKKFWRMMFTRGAVPFVKGRAGEGKSAIIESIATKLGFNFIDLRLSNLDELSVGQYPLVDKENSVDGYKVFDFAVPMWAVESNKRPTIINFEELNRCRQAVMDAVLGILNERRIGSKFKFNDNVFMIATGNLGDEDGTSVNEIDAALKNRLNITRHELTIADWREGYADENVLPMVINFIESKPQEFYRLPENVEEVTNFATPRSWTNLSKHIVAVLGDNPTTTDAIALVEEDGMGIVGNSAIKFIEYLNTIKSITYKDVINKFDKIGNQIAELTRPQRSDIMEDIKKFGVDKLKPSQVDNFLKFIHMLSADEQGAFLTDLVQSHITSIKATTKDEIKNDTTPVVRILREFKSVLQTISNGK